MYAVTGASGQLGRLVIHALMKRVGPEQVVALVRNVESAVDLGNRGVEARKFDYDQPDQLVRALHDVDRLLLISSDDVGRRLTQHRAVVDAALSANVQRIVYTSVIHADENPISVSPSHRETERLIRQSGIPHAFLRNSWYIENYLIGADEAIAHGILLGSTGDGRISAATRADYAAAAVEILTAAAPRLGVYELAGDESFTLADVAEALGEASGRPVAYQHLSEKDYRDALVARGVPAEFAATLAEYSARAGSGILADGSRTLSTLIGRPTETMRDVVMRTIK